MSELKIRWGILGAANIARKNWLAIRNTGNSVVTAVASREAGRARQFITECQAAAPFETVPRSFGSYEALLAAKDVDAVYIPLPTGLRKEWVVRAAEAGKHIVCEKPCAASVAEFREMLEACTSNGVQFMDGVMFMHSRRLEGMREVLADGASVGEIRRLTSAFSFLGDEDFFRSDIRVHSGLEPFGCLGDLGWYCIRLSLWAMKWQLPRAVTGRILSEHGRDDSPMPVPTEFSGELLFDGGVSAGFYCSFRTANEQWANISGTRGGLHLPDFVLPFHGSEAAFEVNSAAFNVEGCDFKMESEVRRMAAAEHSNSHATAQETNLFRNFANQVRSGQLNNAWPEIALKTQQVMEACLASAERDGNPVNVV
ncbi:MAG TPA: Gfo/Idh/MocA family oxidoreductase [Verrucomicrobiae bacterium]|jgi:predicted dehydrogenase